MIGCGSQSWDCPIGEEFGALTVLGKANRKGPSRWKIRCKCGTEEVVLASSLRNHTKLLCANCSRARRKSEGKSDHKIDR